MIYKHTKDIIPYTHEHAHDSPDVSVHMTTPTGVTDTLAASADIGDQDITVTNGAQFATGNKIQLPSEYDLLTIKAINSNVLTLDRELDIAHDIGETVTVVNQNFISDGSSTPIIYSYAPSKLTHIHGLHVLFTSTAEQSLQLFGSAPALTYGLHFYHSKPNHPDRTRHTYWIPVRSLNSMVLSGYSFRVEPKVLGGAWYAHLGLNLTTEDNSLILIDGTRGESFNCVVQDELTGTTNTAMEIKLSTHEVPPAL